MSHLFLLNDLCVPPGKIRETIGALPDNLKRQRLEAEYAYFTGNLDQAAALSEKLSRQNGGAFGVPLIRMVTAVVQGDEDTFIAAKKQAAYNRGVAEGQPDVALWELAMGVIAVSLYDWAECPGWILQGDFSRLPRSDQFFAFYPLVKYLIVHGKNKEAMAIARTVLTLCGKNRDGVTQIYLNMMDAIAAIQLRQVDEAQRVFNRAMERMIPEGFIMPLVEHFSALSTLTEPWKKTHPQFLKKVEATTIQVGYHWIDFHNKMVGDGATNVLTAREYQMAWLAKSGYRNQEIAENMGLAMGTVKAYLRVVYEKLQINNRKDLEQHIL